MGVFYRVRVKVSAPTFKTQFVEGLYVARNLVADIASAKADIECQVIRRFGAMHIPGARVEVVIFRRSDIGFLFTQCSNDEPNIDE